MLDVRGGLVAGHLRDSRRSRRERVNRGFTFVGQNLISDAQRHLYAPPRDEDDMTSLCARIKCGYRRPPLLDDNVMISSYVAS